MHHIAFLDKLSDTWETTFSSFSEVIRVIGWMPRGSWTTISYIDTEINSGIVGNGSPGSRCVQGKEVYDAAREQWRRQSLPLWSCECRLLQLESPELGSLSLCS